MSLSNWKPPYRRTYEDKLLLKYWRKVRGYLFSEVIVGKGGIQEWPKGARPRRIDGVRITPPVHNRLPDDIVTFHAGKRIHEFQQAVDGATVEVIEAKYHLNRVVIGQVIVGADLLGMEYKPAQIRMVVVCKVGDPVLELVCKNRNIEVVIL